MYNVLLLLSTEGLGRSDLTGFNEKFDESTIASTSQDSPFIFLVMNELIHLTSLSFKSVIVIFLNMRKINGGMPGPRPIVRMSISASLDSWDEFAKSEDVRMLFIVIDTFEAFTIVLEIVLIAI